jgi:valyl-tRNA synthetase
MDLPKKYNSNESEAKWIKYWEENKIYKFKKKKPIFSIDTPPPTVSGKMHIGHAFSYSQQDFIARYKRMNGDVFYPFGTDDNGLPTERLVEKINNVKSKNMSRAEFINLCIKTLKKITPDFINDWKSLGISADYDLCYSTIDKNSQKISQKSFMDLYKNKRIYKKEFPTIWCPECQTSIAQAELEDKEQSSYFSTIKFKANNKDLLIATTRPELLPACVAIFVNPEDKRYKNLIGKKAIVPLFNQEVPIISDESADIEKGTGVLMVCSYGDKFDVDAINRHKLSPKLILDKDGTLNTTEYKGLRIKQARKKILEDLKSNDLIKEQKQISHVVNVHDKCGTEIEFLTTEQWFITLLDKKKELISQGKKIKWYPQFMFKRYENWIKGLDWDWNISRDRHFGIPIPIWYCKKCDKNILPEEKELPIDPLQVEKKCPKCKEIAEPEKKVLDTWATSSLTPQIAASLVKDKIKLPYDLRPQAHDIIRTWAFYTATKSYFHEKKIPWKNIMVSGFVTLGGEKMSKSKGNVIDPKTVLENYSADALRFWAAGSKLGEDLDYQEKDLITGQKTITKLWNASKFTFMHLEDFKNKPKKLEATDLYLLSKLQTLITNSTKYFENYEYSKTKAEVDYFFWHTFCDNYLEIVKDRLYNPDKRGKESRQSAQYTVYTTLLTLLKLTAPIMPFITEEIYQLFYKKIEKESSIHITSWPKVDKKLINKKLEQSGDELINIISQVRQFKNKNQTSLKTPVKLTLEKKHEKILKPFLEDLKATTQAEKIDYSNKFNVVL